MTYEEFDTALKTVDIPSAFCSFDEAQTGDYICWITDEVNITHADDSPIFSDNIIRIELYTLMKNEAQEKKVEKFLSEHGFDWDKDPEIWLEDEKIFMINYYFSL